jgi:hypothetical protein
MKASIAILVGVFAVCLDLILEYIVQHKGVYCNSCGCVRRLLRVA